MWNSKLRKSNQRKSCRTVKLLSIQKKLILSLRWTPHLITLRSLGRRWNSSTETLTEDRLLMTDISSHKSMENSSKVRNSSSRKVLLLLEALRLIWRRRNNINWLKRKLELKPSTQRLASYAQFSNAMINQRQFLMRNIRKNVVDLTG